MCKIVISFNNRIVCCGLVLLIIVMLLSGCGSKEDKPASMAKDEVDREPAASAEPPVPPKSHLWDVLYEADAEPPGYAMYTYVLINRSKVDTAAWSRYKKLVETIMSSTTPAHGYHFDFNKSLYNLFLIPYTSEGPERAESLNDILSKSILTSIAASVQKQKLRELINTNPGPFLISSTEPISNEKLSKDIELLYVDLTRTNLDAMPELVAEYKKRLTSDPIERIERFKSIRLSLLNLILDADDYISIVKVAYAGWIKD